MYKVVLWKFSNKNINLKALWFFEYENFSVRATHARKAEIADFLELSS